MFVPSLSEAEARYLILKFLAQAPKQQGDVGNFREFIKESRTWGVDNRPNPTRSNAPFWHQIVQNALDRLIKMNPSWVLEVEEKPNRKIRLNNHGNAYLEELNSFFTKFSDLNTHTHFDNTILGEIFAKNRKLFRDTYLIDSTDKFVFLVRSETYEKTWRPDLSKRNFGHEILTNISKSLAKRDMDVDEREYRSNQIEKWIWVRSDCPLDDLSV